MKRLSLIATFVCAASPALADFPDTVRDQILPGYAAFAQTSAQLAASTADCDPAKMQPAFQTAYDAWEAVAHIRLGPIEEGGKSLAIAYWPDPKGLGLKQQKALLAGDPSKLTPEAMAEQSVAARGFSGLERLLYPAGDLTGDTCALTKATAADLARMAAEVNAAWQDGYAQTLLSAGEAGNTTYLSRPEARQALFTQLATALEILEDQRIGRPLGTLEKPTPAKAEARASGRSLRNILLQLQALRAMTLTLTPDAPKTLAAFDRAIKQAEGLNDPVFDGIVEPTGWLKLQILQQDIEALRDSVTGELGPELDVGLGFNAADGD
jgi:uncharacterized protein